MPEPISADTAQLIQGYLQHIVALEAALKREREQVADADEILRTIVAKAHEARAALQGESGIMREAQRE